MGTNNIYHVKHDFFTLQTAAFYFESKFMHVNMLASYNYNHCSYYLREARNIYNEIKKDQLAFKQSEMMFSHH